VSLLRVTDLVVSVVAPRGRTRIIDGIDLALEPRGALALVGESGSGKSLTAYALMNLLPAGAQIDRGSVVFMGKDLVTLPDDALQRIRGAQMSMVFQEPSTALNPVYTIGSQICEAVRLHRSMSRRQAADLAATWLAKVGMPDPKRALGSYPHELSGGMKQRALLAIALVCGPALLIADEPTTSLDRTLEAQILELMSAERADRGMGLLIVAHDLATVAEITDDIVVLYAGQVVEAGPTRDVLARPAHPYAQALVESIPNPDAHRARVIGEAGPRLPVLAGGPPSFDALPAGCRFAPRCKHVFDRCTSEAPALYAVAAGRYARCFLHEAAGAAPDQSPIEGDA